MRTLDLVEILKSPPDRVSADGRALFWLPAPFNSGELWIGHFKGTGPWTRHVGGDALMHQLSGRAEVTLRAADGEHVATMIPGQVLRVPAGTWYRVHTADWAAQYGVTTAGTEHAEGDAAP
ncbi:MAG: hypothetical protein IPK64_18300 [bacterium]|nr:hypothetical protein [bacterium]